jgi:glycosyltransferase involved in cell wall biosynthesis
MIRRLSYFHYLYGDDTALNHVRQFVDAARELGVEINSHDLNLGNRVPTPGTRSPLGRVRPLLKRYLSRLLHEPKELAWNLRYLALEESILRHERPDVLLVRDSLYNFSYLIAARRCHAPVVVEVNAPAVESRMYRHDYWHIPWAPERIERDKLRRADAVIAVSSPLRKHLIDHVGISSNRVHVVPNGADVERFSQRVTPDPEITARVGDAPVVGFVGSFAAWHGPDMLAEVAVRVCRRRPDVRFVFVGDGDCLDDVKRSTAEVAGQVIFTGRVSHERVPALVRTFRIGLLAETGFYCCPLKVLEWMASGIAVVAPDYASMRDIVDEGTNAVLFPTRNVETAISTILSLLDAPERCAAIGHAAATKVRDQLTWRHNAQRVLSICSSVAEHHANNA